MSEQSCPVCDDRTASIDNLAVGTTYTVYEPCGHFVEHGSFPGGHTETVSVIGETMVFSVSDMPWRPEEKP